MKSVVGRAFVHIGVSRSGTTTLQRNVFERLEGVHYLGKFGKFHKSYPIAARWCEANTTLLERAKESIVRGTICPREDVQRLRASLEKLKARKSSMPELEYEKELERIVVAIAERTAAIRALGGQP